MTQVSYYNEFATRYRSQILAAPDASIWVKDAVPGPTQEAIQNAMKQRITMQKEMIRRHFYASLPVLDLGCGFGRQLVVMAAMGMKVVGVDTSNIFIDIARELSRKHGMDAELICDSVEQFTPPNRFSQVVLFDLYEHILPKSRRRFLDHLHGMICAPQGKAIFTFPFVDSSLMSRAKNLGRSWAYHIPAFAKREHPYPIPNDQRFRLDIAGRFSILDYLSSGGTSCYVLAALNSPPGKAIIANSSVE